MKMINRLFRFTWFPLVLQLLTLVVFVMLIVGGLSADTSDMAFAKTLRNTNAANLIVWSYWWPLIILFAIFLGRVWCAVCPMELVTSLASKVGLKRKPSVFLRSGWAMTIFYIIILFVGIHTLAIHRVPFRMAIYMLALFGASVASGLLFSRNAFCAHICPVGHLLELYARLAPIEWGVRDKSLCSKCKDQSCVSKKTAYKFQGRSCGVGLKPAKLDDSSKCLFCGQCLKACDRNNPGVEERPNPGLFQRGWFKGLLEIKPLSSSQTAFCLIMSGFVVYEVFTEWAATKELLLWAPTILEQALGANGAWGHGVVKSTTLFALLPAIFWLTPFAMLRLAGGRLPLKEYLLKFSAAFIPIMAAAHAVKALLKMTSRVPYWKYAATDPVGVETARDILNNTAPLAASPFWLAPILTFLGLGLMAAGVTLSFLVVKKLIKEHLPKSDWSNAALYLIPGLYGGLFYVMLIAWRLL